MGQNLKELFKKDRLVNHTRKDNHEDFFIEKLYTELPVKKQHSFMIFKIAASVMVFVALGIVSYILMNHEENLINSEFILSDISPDLKEIEIFYVTNINNTLSEIQKNGNDQSVFERYMKRLSILKEEYKRLSAEINEEGPNTMSINALVNNLKLQLELLQVLKSEMISFKNIKHETI